METNRTARPSKTVNQKQYHIPGGITAISVTTKDLKDAGVVFHTTSPFNSHIQSVQNTDGFWRLTVDYQKFNQMVTTTAAALPDVCGLSKLTHSLYQVCSYSPGKCLFLSFLSIRFTKVVYFQLAMPAIHLPCLPSGAHQLSSPVLKSWGLDLLSLPKGITLVYHTDDIMLIKHNVMIKKQQLL